MTTTGDLPRGFGWADGFSESDYDESFSFGDVLGGGPGGPGGPSGPSGHKADDAYGRYGYLPQPRDSPRRPPPPPPYGVRPTMADYHRAIAHYQSHPGRTGGLTHLRALTIRGVRAGTISPHEVLCRVRPAAVAVSVLAEQQVADTGKLIAARIAAAAGTDPERWSTLIDRVESWTGSLLSMLTDDAPGTRPTLPPSRPNAWTGHLWRPANILLALAPAECARHFLTAGAVGTAVRRAGLAQRMAGFVPLSRALVEHTLSSRGSGRARLRLAANAFTPDPVLAELLRWVGEPAIATAVREHDFAGGAIRYEAFQAVRDRPEAMRGSLAVLLEYGQRQFLDLLAAVPDHDAVGIHTLIKLAGDALDRDTRRAAYARLAEVCEPEAVWTLDLGYAGSLEAMEPRVRESMATGDAGSLTAMLRTKPFRDPYRQVNAAATGMRRADLLDRPLPWLR